MEVESKTTYIQRSEAHVTEWLSAVHGWNHLEHQEYLVNKPMMGLRNTISFEQMINLDENTCALKGAWIEYTLVIH